MAGAAFRITALAGVLASGLLLGGLGSGVAAAEPGDIIGHGGGNHSGKSGDRKPGSSAVRVGARTQRTGLDIGSPGAAISIGPRGVRAGVDLGPGGPRFSFGPRGIRVRPGGATSTGTAQPDSAGSGDSLPGGQPKAGIFAPATGISPQRLTIVIPVPRLPAFNGSGSGVGNAAQSAFTTVSISVSTGASLRLSIQAQPQPTPRPTPAPAVAPRTAAPSIMAPSTVGPSTVGPDLRRQGGPQEEPVIDADSGRGGSGYSAAANEPQPITAPMVIAPPPPAMAPALPPKLPPITEPLSPIGVAAPPKVGAGAATAPSGAPGSPASAGSGTPPAARGASPEPAPGSSAVGMGRQAPREGYQQYLRTAQLTELAAIALPGIAGLLCMTVSGGLIGYRQANALRTLRRDRYGRFLAD